MKESGQEKQLTKNCSNKHCTVFAQLQPNYIQLKCERTNKTQTHPGSNGCIYMAKRKLFAFAMPNSAALYLFANCLQIRKSIVFRWEDKIERKDTKIEQIKVWMTTMSRKLFKIGTITCHVCIAQNIIANVLVGGGYLRWLQHFTVVFMMSLQLMHTFVICHYSILLQRWLLRLSNS